jgi:hypothetical protein
MALIFRLREGRADGPSSAYSIEFRCQTSVADPISRASSNVPTQWARNATSEESDQRLQVQWPLLAFYQI